MHHPEALEHFVVLLGVDTTQKGLALMKAEVNQII